MGDDDQTVATDEDKTVPELQDELRDAGLPVSGNKDELIERLAEHNAGGVADGSGGDAPLDETAPPVAHETVGDQIARGDFVDETGKQNRQIPTA